MVCENSPLIGEKWVQDFSIFDPIGGKKTCCHAKRLYAFAQPFCTFLLSIYILSFGTFCSDQEAYFGFDRLAGRVCGVAENQKVRAGAFDGHIK